MAKRKGGSNFSDRGDAKRGKNRYVRGPIVKYGFILLESHTGFRKRKEEKSKYEIKYFEWDFLIQAFVD